jgi:CheY-like chemotaxis protein
MGPLKILAVDDEKDLLALLCMRLRAEGLGVLEATDGKMALEKVKSENPDIVLMDVMMPVMDGYEVLRQLKADDRYKQIPVILLTVKSKKADLQKSKDLGADAHLIKPYNDKELLETIYKLVKSKKAA